jgi:hypothetical protein
MEDAGLSTRLVEGKSKNARIEKIIRSKLVDQCRTLSIRGDDDWMRVWSRVKRKYQSHREGGSHNACACRMGLPASLVIPNHEHKMQHWPDVLEPLNTSFRAMSLLSSGTNKRLDATYGVES